MAVALDAAGRTRRQRSQVAIALCLAVFGLGFGMVGQVLTSTVQNGVDRGRLGIAMATTTSSARLGGAVGAAVLGAVFASQGSVVEGVRLVFSIAAPLALLALALVWRLSETKLEEGAPAQDRPASAPARPAIGAAR